MTISKAEKSVTTPRESIDPALFGRLVARVQEDEGLDREAAENVMEQALAFLEACALNPGKRLAPSRRVDAGWHAFILHTYEYTEFCERIAGRYLHHRPTEPGEAPLAAQALGATVAAIREAGYPVDASLWIDAARCTEDCSQCHAGCYDDPRGEA